MTQPLLRTKTIIPPLRPNAVERKALVNKLDETTRQALTLIEAPAGFGKTSLAAAWAMKCPFPVAWLSLTESDKSEERFLSYIVHALQTIFPKIGQTTLALIHANPIDNALFSLINDLSEIEPQYTLIIDDFHTVDTPETANIIQFMLENRPPNFHMVLVTRNKPSFSLTRLRAKGQISEINIDEIRFTSEEIKTFLTTCMKLSIPDLEITKLANTTEGWPVGLQLAALAYTRNTQDWHLPISQTQIFDYLAEEVLNKESKPVQDFLIKSAIFDRFSLPLIQYLNDSKPPGELENLLEQVDKSNLFLIHLDHDNMWFRYHALFLEFLRKQISKEEAIPLYQKASQWFKDHEMLDDAIDYAIHAGDYEPAAKLLDINYREVLSRGDHASMFEWIEALPESILQKYPRLWLTNGWAYMISLEPGLAIRCAKKAEAVCKNHEQEQFIFMEAQAIINMALIFLGNTKGITINSKDFELFYEQDDFLHSMLHFTHGLFHSLNGDTALALESFSQTMELDTIEKISLLFILTYTQSGETRYLRGAFGLAERTFQKAIQYGKQMYGENSVLLSLPYMSYGELLREQNQLSTAMEYLQTGIHFCYIWEPVFSMDGQISLARIYAAQGLWEKAFQQLENTIALIKNDGIILNDIFVAIYLAKLYIQHGDIPAARQTIEFYKLDQLDYDPYYIYELSKLMLIRLNINEAIQMNKPVDDLIDSSNQLLQKIQTHERQTSEIELIILQAYIYQHAKQSTRAIRSLSRALTLGAQCGFVRIFADEGQTLLSLLIQYHDKLSVPATYLDFIQNIMLAEADTSSSTKISRQDQTIIPLTRRELDILQCMAAGETNQETAEKLILSIHTVKKHVANILSKLNVSNRTQAVILARRMTWIK